MINWLSKVLSIVKIVSFSTACLPHNSIWIDSNNNTDNIFNVSLRRIPNKKTVFTILQHSLITYQNDAVNDHRFFF